jgi:RHS repeat-associated protein
LALLTYNSQIAQNRMTGNWWFPWDIYVVPQPNGDLKYYEPPRAGDVYTWDAVNQVYVSPPGYFDLMVQTQGGGWTRTTKDGYVWQFNASGGLIWIRDRYGLQTTLNRNAQNQITSIVDFAGRATTLAYYSNGYLSSVTDWAGNSSTYTYTSQGYLASITYPATTFFDKVTQTVVTRPKTVNFQYLTNTGNSNLDGNLTSYVDDAGTTALAFSYDTQDRAITASSWGHQWTIQYGATTVVTDPDGVTTAYSFNATGAVTRLEVFTRTGLGQQPLRQGEPNSYVWTFQRASGCNCDLVTQVTRPDGSTVSVSYDAIGNPVSRTVTPPTGSSLSSRTETWTWSSFAQFSQLLSHTKPGAGAQGVNPADFTTTWTRDALGNATTVSYPKATINGVLTTPTVTTTYNTYGQPTSETWPNGTVCTVAYAANTLDLLSITHDSGQGRLNLVSQYAYDSLSRLTSVTDPRGNTVTRQYNALGELTQIQVPAPQATQTKFLYDNDGMLHSVDVENKDASNQQVGNNPWFTTVYGYDSTNRLVSVAHEVDSATTATTQYQYTAAGRPWKTIDPVGNVTETLYDERGLVFKRTEGFGTSVAGTTSFNYTLNGDLASVVNPRGYTTSNASDHEGWLRGSTDPAGVSAVWAYDLDGHLTQVESRDAQAITILRMSYEYDPYGLLLRTRRHILDAQGNTTQTFTTSYQYDSGLSLVRVTDALGNAEVRTHDAVRRLTQVQDAASNTESFAYDGNGNLVSHTIQTWNQVAQAYDTLVLEGTYDSQNRRTQTLRRDGANTVSTAHAWTYDSRGNVLDETDEVGNTRHFAYDGMGRRTTTTVDLRTGGTGSGAVTGTIVNQIGYDLAGRATSARDGLNQQTTYAYDSRDRMISETNTASGVRSFTYDGNGNILTSTDPVGTVVANTYDSRDLLTGRAITRATGVLGTTAEAYTYDALARPLTAVDDDSTILYAYDTLGRPVSETEGPNPIGASGKTFSYAQNAVDTLTRMVYPDGTVELRSRDMVQRLTSVAIQGGPTLATYQYGGARVRQVGLQNGVTRTSTFDALWRETLVEYKNGPTSLRKFEYIFNNADYRLLEKRHHAAGTGDNYALDSLYRTVNVKEGVSDPVLEYQAPGSQTVTTVRAPTYDAAQNRTQVAVTPNGGSTTTTAYSADALNFYSAVGGAVHVRDANGNLRDDGARLYEYDYRNQLCRVKDKATGNTIATYDYDAVSRRIAKSTSTATWSYYWAFETLTMEFDASGQFSRRHFGRYIDEIVSASQRDLADLNGNGSTTDFVWLTPAYDGAMDCAATIGPGGTVVESYVHSYDGVVSITNATGQTIAPSAVGWTQGFGGMQRDDETGFAYARLRYYTPLDGRFLNGDRQGSWYDSVALGNSYSWIGNAYRQAADPWGLCKIEVAWKIAFYIPGKHQYHGFIVVTDDDGSQSYYRGGPESNYAPSSSRSSRSSRASSSKTQKSGMHGFGAVIAESGKYEDGTPDYENGNFPVMTKVTVYDVPGPCCNIKAKLQKGVDFINAHPVRYRPARGPRGPARNSNSVVAFVLMNAGITPPAPPVDAPGHAQNPYDDDHQYQTKSYK